MPEFRTFRVRIPVGLMPQDGRKSSSACNFKILKLMAYTARMAFKSIDGGYLDFMLISSPPVAVA